MKDLAKSGAPPLVEGVVSRPGPFSVERETPGLDNDLSQVYKQKGMRGKACSHHLLIL